MPHSLDATTVRGWCELALEALGQARTEIDAINVYPVADGDTGTNLYLTVESATQAVVAACAGEPTPAEAVRAMAHGALIGARGNSGTILAQLLRGMAEVYAENAAPASAPAAEPGPSGVPGLPAAPAAAAGPATAPAAAAAGEPAPAAALRSALRRAAAAAYEAVAHPVEGTMLTVAAAAADAAERARAMDTDAAAVALAAYRGARTALAETPRQLDALGRAGVVDAGGSGLVTVLGALVEALSGGGLRVGGPTSSPGLRPGPYRSPAPAAGTERGSGRKHTPGADRAPGVPGVRPAGPSFEVTYLLEADDAAVRTLRRRLDGLGDSLVVIGGDGLWNVHIHVDDAGAAVEEGIRAGRPYRIRIEQLGPVAPGREPGHDSCGTRAGEDCGAGGPGTPAVPPRQSRRAVVAVVPGDGLAGLCAEAGATVVTARPGEPLASGELVAAIHRAHTREVVLLPNDAALRHTAAAAAEQARADGLRVAVIPTRSPVQGIAALAVHEPGRSFDEDVVAMTSAAGATRYAELTIAERESWTTAGICQAGDVLGMVDGDVAVIGGDLAGTAATVLDRMLAGGGELVTLVLGAHAPEGLAELLDAHVRRSHLAVDTVVYPGQQAAPLLIGVE